MLVGRPEPLFQVGAPILDAIYWSVTPDGEKFLTVNTQTRDAPAHCNLVPNWPGIRGSRSGHGSRPVPAPRCPETPI